MYISKLMIHGFRSIYHTEIEFRPGKNVLVGKNNCGKSNIVKALDLVIGERYPTSTLINETDFHLSLDGKQEKEFCILCEIKGEDLDFQRIEKLKGIFRGYCNEPPIQNEKTNIEVNEEVLFVDPDALDYRTSKTYFKGDTLRTFAASLKRANTYYFVLRVSNTLEEDDYPIDFRFAYQENDGSWYICWGLNKEFRNALITSAVLPAFREPSGQLRITNWSWYGKLIKDEWDNKGASDPNLNQGLSDALERVKSAGEPVYRELSERINAKIRIGFSDTKVRLQFAATASPDIHKQVCIYVNDGIDAHITSKGSGIQSAIIIGLFSYYCSVQHKNTSVLVVEEPEIFLHPQARRAISRRLDEFIAIHKGDDKSNQVIITTHAAEFVQSGEAATITVVKKYHNATRVKSIDFTSNTEQKQLQKVVRANSAEMFFADKVILCEGAELYLLPKVADMIKDQIGTLDESNISVIRVDGKGSFKSYCDVLEKIDIPWFILADLDFLTSGLEKFVNAHEPKFDLIKMALLKLQDECGEVKNSKIKEKLLTPGKSMDAKEFVRAMKVFAKNPDDASAKEKLLHIWEYVEPHLKPKLDKSILDSDLELSQKLGSYLDHLFNEKNIWILRNGDLEEYARKDDLGKELFDSGKINDAKLLKVCRDESKDISRYFELLEFTNFLNKILPVAENNLSAEESVSAIKVETGQLFSMPDMSAAADDLPF
jgi:putative ATP-dependent endonuclease of the OLD family